VVVTSEADYVSNQLMLLSLARRRGIVVRRAADLPEGGVDPDSVAALVRERRPAAILLSWIPTNSGMIQDAEAVGTVARRYGIPYLLDACQAVGQLPVDVSRLGCDFLAGTGRKFLRGPRGIGFLYVGDRMLEAGRYPLFVDLRGATWTDPDRFEPDAGARRFENWEFAYALVLGLGAAAGYAAQAIEAGALGRTEALAARVRSVLGELPSVGILDRGSRQSAIITATVAGIDPSRLVLSLRQRGINTSWFPRSAAVLDADRKGIAAGWRVSPHYYNLETEIDSLADAVRAAIAPGSGASLD
jgi:selenocysteine lyase/cysteine desulfurase